MERSISIVIPFRDELDALAELIRRLDLATTPLERWFEVIMVDDASTDGGSEIVERATRDRAWLRLIRLDSRGGQTGAFRAAFATAKGEWLIRIDSDLQDDPRDLPKFLEKIDLGIDLIIGFRDQRQHHFVDKLLTVVYNLVVLLLFNPPVRSFSGSFVAFRTACVAGAPLWTNDHRYLPLIALRRGASRIEQVFVKHEPRTTGCSKYLIWKKFLLGPPELLLFFIRYRLGLYDRREAGETPL